MRIVVCVKQIYDPATVKISRSREDFDLRQAVKRTNPLDRYALEAALRLRDSLGGDVVALTVGAAEAEDTLRDAVAMGADRGLLLAGDDLADAGGAGIARAIAAAVERLGAVDLLLTGQIDPVGGSGSMAARLAAVLGWPLVLDAVCLQAPEEGSIEAVVRDAGGALAVPVPAPAVVAVVPGSDRPRWPVAHRIANAYAPGLVDIWPAGELGLDSGSLAAETENGGLVLGPERARGQQLDGSVDEAVNMLAEMLRSKRVI
jgi:electron transfer flavoprotein beta subunit